MNAINEVIPNALAGERVDRVVALLGEVSRTAAHELLAAGNVKIDGVVVTKPSSRVTAEQELELVVPEAVSVLPEADPSVEFEVVYVDDDVIVVNKPAGLIVHPGAGVSEKTLVNGLLAQFPEISSVGDSARPGIVHRLDAGTTGLLVVARNQDAYESLVEQLANHSAQRDYIALVHGTLESNVGAIEAPIGRSASDRTRMGVVANGKDARTHYVVAESFNSPAPYSLVNCQLETGRTHQIRVHFAAISHPVVGDETYGGARGPIAIERPLLHAARLSFLHPTKHETGEFSAPLPTDFGEVLEKLRAANE